MIQQNLPGILNDRQIRQLCTPPVWMVTEMVAQFQDTNVGVYLLPQPKTYVSYESETELFAKLQQYEQNKRQTPYPVGVSDFRKLTPDELAEFKPMIAPFFADQQRFIERDFNTSDAVLWGRMRKAGESQEAILAAFQERNRAVLGIRSDPILGGQIREKIVSFGLTSFGYDVRPGRNFKIFTNINSSIVDPKNVDPKSFVDFEGDVCIIPPNSFVLANTMERFCLPRNVVADCLGKSTYARCGISIMVTPLEPEWEGYLTLEFANTTPLPAKLYAGEGCGQIRFFQGEDCEVSYKDRAGKYMDQPDRPVVPAM
jgi:dCTP deaminase